MAKLAPAYTDGNGHPHKNADEATVSDFGDLLGNLPLARDVFAKRKEVERIFAEHDAMLGLVVPLANWEQRWAQNPDGPNCA